MRNHSIIRRSLSLFVEVHAGSRLLELRPEIPYSDEVNPITSSLLSTLSEKISLYERNHTIAAVVIGLFPTI